MSIGTSSVFPPGVSPLRRVPRYELAVPLSLTVVRSGLPAKIRGQTLQIGEGGIGVAVGSHLLVGECVRVEFLLPHTSSPVRATAVVRYQHERCFGLQFLRFPFEQQTSIRYWTRCEAELFLVTQRSRAAQVDATPEAAAVESMRSLDPLDPRRSKLSISIPHLVAVAIPLIVITALLGWQRWQQEGTGLEGRGPAEETVLEKPQFKVPADTMQQRISHFVTPEYPEAARQAGVQGTVVLDAVVNAEGRVTQVRLVSGPEVLSLAAIDAVRWWRYEPYLVNGQPTTVETSIIVNFRLAN
jgi:TonB family protein